MRMLVMVAAWAVSAALVLPTVSQGQNRSPIQQAVSVLQDDATGQQQA